MRILEDPGITKNRSDPRCSISEEDEKIYYDTDWISEQKQKAVRTCDDRGGLVIIDSMASTGNRIPAVVIPGLGFSNCREEGEAAFAPIDRDKYQMNRMYFPDRDRDVYIRK